MVIMNKVEMISLDTLANWLKHGYIINVIHNKFEEKVVSVN